MSPTHEFSYLFKFFLSTTSIPLLSTFLDPLSDAQVQVPDPLTSCFHLSSNLQSFHSQA